MSGDQQFYQHPRYDRVDYASLIAAPIKRSGQVTEILCVTMSHQRARLDIERDRIELLTIQVGRHLENVYLYDQIRSNNNRMRAILDSTRDGIILLDQTGRLIDGNISAESMLHLSLEDYVYHDFAEVLLNLSNSEAQADIAENGLTHLMRDLRLNSQNIKQHAFQLRSNGQIRYIESVGSPVMDSRGDVIGRLLTWRDVTEEKMLEEWREEVIHMLVHDLREPLGSIIGSIHYSVDILNDVGDATGISQLLEISLDSASNLHNLVENILDIYKMENRRMPLNRAPSNIVDIVQETITKLSGGIQEANVNVNVEIPPETPPIYVDPQIIERVLTNLVGNAIRFTPAEGQILIHISPPNVLENIIMVRVADSGTGIPLEEIERVFEKFRQVEGSAPLRGNKGSGVGLAFCKTAIEAHDQKIWIEPDGPLSGASFVFTLPIATDKDLSESSAGTNR